MRGIFLLLLILEINLVFAVQNAKIVFGDSGAAASDLSGNLTLISAYKLSGTPTEGIITVIIETIKIWWENILVANLRE